MILCGAGKGRRHGQTKAGPRAAARGGREPEGTIPVRSVGSHRPARQQTRTAPGGGAHRLGQEPGLFHRNPPAASEGAWSHPDRQSPAFADARPGRGSTPHRRGGRQLQLEHQPGNMAGAHAGDRAGRGRCNPGCSGTVRGPGLHGGRPETDREEVGPARHRRGALHFPVGARIPAGLPPDPSGREQASAEDPRPGRHGDGDRGGHHRHRRPDRRHDDAARVSCPRVDRAGRPQASVTVRAAGLACPPHTAAAQGRDRVRADAQRCRHGRGLAAESRALRLMPTTAE